MDARFPLLLPQRQINARSTARTLALPAAPSLPWGEWLIAAVGLLLLLAL